MDPIAELVSDLRETGKPSLKWIVQWSQDGRDPVQAAWEACENPNWMQCLFVVVYGYDSKQRKLLGDAVDNTTLPTWQRGGVAGAERIKAAGIKPPTLAALLEARQRATA